MALLFTDIENGDILLDIMLATDDQLAAMLTSAEASHEEIKEMMAYKEDMRDIYLGLLLGNEELPEKMTYQQKMAALLKEKTKQEEYGNTFFNSERFG